VNRTVRTILIYFAVVTVLWLAFSAWFDAANAPEEIDFTKLDALVEDGEVGTVRFFPDANKVEVRSPSTSLEEPAEYTIAYPDQFEDELLIELQAQGVEVSVDPEPTSIGTVLLTLLPWIFILGFMFIIFTQMQGGGNRVMQFGKSKAKQMTKDQPKVTFNDVAGLEEESKSLKRSRTSCKTPPNTGQWAPRSPAACCYSGLQVPVKRCWREPLRARPGCHSSRFPVPTS